MLQLQLPSLSLRFVAKSENACSQQMTPSCALPACLSLPRNLSACPPPPTLITGQQLLARLKMLPIWSLGNGRSLFQWTFQCLPHLHVPSSLLPSPPASSLASHPRAKLHVFLKTFSLLPFKADTFASLRPPAPDSIANAELPSPPPWLLLPADSAWRTLDQNARELTCCISFGLAQSGSVARSQQEAIVLPYGHYNCSAPARRWECVRVCACVCAKRKQLQMFQFKQKQSFGY